MSLRPQTFDARAWGRQAGSLRCPITYRYLPLWAVGTLVRVSRGVPGARAMLVCPARRRMLMTRLPGHDVGSGASPAAEVFAEGNVADPVQLVLGFPVAADPFGELGWRGLAGRQ